MCTENSRHCPHVSTERATPIEPKPANPKKDSPDGYGRNVFLVFSLDPIRRWFFSSVCQFLPSIVSVELKPMKQGVGKRRSSSCDVYWSATSEVEGTRFVGPALRAPGGVCNRAIYQSDPEDYEDQPAESPLFIDRGTAHDSGSADCK